jgi:hypothetical protein
MGGDREAEIHFFTGVGPTFIAFRIVGVALVVAK